MTDTASDRAVVEQAKGAIMLRYGVGSCEALAAVARWAHEAHVTVPDLAHALVKGICQGRVTPENRGVVRWLEHRLRSDIAPDIAEAPEPAPTVTLRAAPTTAVVAARQWRYASAVHAARAVSSP
jgi:hypothetical protein